ncbi:hypothetical protein [Moorena sp. SIO3I6]|uniref:hypothetical protein n=1 Tax=Moorena sp. SIO3I6 TaxID=2607831 RepID=UPI0013F885EF|nr:hypothetical protein [Moorena sp. SIO3I6]NEP23983.1 hypothetical protein [Moorena sp. SIO3I6]
MSSSLSKYTCWLYTDLPEHYCHLSLKLKLILPGTIAPQAQLEAFVKEAKA